MRQYTTEIAGRECCVTVAKFEGVYRVKLDHPGACFACGERKTLVDAVAEAAENYADIMTAGPHHDWQDPCDALDAREERPAWWAERFVRAWNAMEQARQE